MINTHTNTFILDLYRKSKELSVHEFKYNILTDLGALIDFDSSIWVTGSTEHGVNINGIYLYNQPMEMMVNYERFMREDLMAKAHIDRPNLTYNTSDLYCRDEFVNLPIYKDHCKIFGIEHSLSTAVSPRSIPLTTVISIYRSDPTDPFCESERVLKEILSPHLVEAFSNCCFYNTNNSIHNNSKISEALVDSKGVIYECDNKFAGTLTTEWPEWGGVLLPNSVIELIANKTPIFMGNNISIRIEQQQDLFHILLTNNILLNELTKREREITAIISNGGSNKTIANQLDISPSTVNNHLNKIYKKLRVNNRTELAREVASS